MHHALQQLPVLLPRPFHLVQQDGLPHVPHLEDLPQHQADLPPRRPGARLGLVRSLRQPSHQSTCCSAPTSPDHSQAAPAISLRLAHHVILLARPFRPDSQEGPRHSGSPTRSSRAASFAWSTCSRWSASGQLAEAAPPTTQLLGAAPHQAVDLQGQLHHGGPSTT